MTILSGWDSTGCGWTSKYKTIDITKLSDTEVAAITAQHLRAMRDVPLWDMFGGVVNLGHRHFQVSP